MQTELGGVCFGGELFKLPFRDGVIRSRHDQGVATTRMSATLRGGAHTKGERQRAAVF